MSSIGLFPVSYPVSTSPGTPPRPRRSATTPPPAPRKSYSHRRSIEEPDLSCKLHDCGLSIERQILAQDQDGSVTSPYAKVQSEDGDEMLVVLDLPGKLPLDENEQPLVMRTEPRDESILPMLNQDIVGIGYVCEGNVCIKLGEQTQHLGEVSKEGGLVEVYPIVKMSHLIDNPSRVMSSAKTTNLRMKEQSIINAQGQLKLLGDNLAALSREYSALVNQQAHAANHLFASINQLSQLKNQYKMLMETGRSLSTIDQQKYDLILAGLKRRYKLLKELSVMDQKLAQLNDEVSQAVTKLKEANTFLANQFQDLSRV